MGHDGTERDLRVLVVDPPPSQLSRVGNALGESGVSVDTVPTVGEALERLAWPGIDCLVVGHDPGAFDGLAAAKRIDDKHPSLPVVAVSKGGTVESEVVDAVVADDPDVAERLLAAVRDLAAETIGPEAYVTDEPTDPPWANVDAAEVDRLMEEGIDRETLTELMHKSALFESLLNSLPVHLYVKDREARHRYASGHFEGAPEAFLGKTDPEIGMVTDSHERRAYAEDRHVIDTGEPILDKVEYLPLRDEWNLTSKVPWRGPDDEVVGLIGVTWEITERMERQERIRRQNERLDRFAEMVSHDLRNPLHAAKMHVEMARTADSPDEHLNDVDRSLQRMDDLIEDVLELAQHGEQVIDPSPVDLEDAVTMAWGAMDVPHATVETVDPLGRVLGEQGRLRQLLANLFRNAIDHVGVDAAVRIGRLDDGTGFYVEDDGEGFPDDLDLFAAGTTTAADGTGFGLSIVREIAAAHGWTVEATTAADGGARLEFTGVEWADDTG